MNHDDDDDDDVDDDDDDDDNDDDDDDYDGGNYSETHLIMTCSDATPSISTLRQHSCANRPANRCRVLKSADGV